MDSNIVPQNNKKERRTPNTECVICGKPLYRRPFEFKKARYFACMEHRNIAQDIAGQTEAQLAALDLGREKGTNHLEGIPKSEKSKQKRSKSMKRWARENPDKAVARARRGEKHHAWKGGTSSLNQSIRRMVEHRRWMDAVKDRDNACVRCGSTIELESHHIKPMAELIEELEIKSRKDARKNKTVFWDIDNGITLCRKCHCEEHNRQYTPIGKGRRSRRKSNDN